MQGRLRNLPKFTLSVCMGLARTRIRCLDSFHTPCLNFFLIRGVSMGHPLAGIGGVQGVMCLGKGTSRNRALAIEKGPQFLAGHSQAGTCAAREPWGWLYTGCGHRLLLAYGPESPLGLSVWGGL